PSTPATTLTTTLNIGGVSDDFSVSTVGVVAPAADTTPDAFSFSPQTGVGLSATVTSNAVTLKGLNSPAVIRISGGLYSVNAGAFVSTAGTVKAGDAVTLQVNASAQYGQTVTATLNIGGVTGTFSVTTGSAPAVVSGVDLAQILAGQPVDLAPQASSGTSYGQAMAVQGDVLWMGAPAETSQGQKARGAVHVWQRTAGGAFQEQGLPLSRGKAGDGFGSRIVLTETQAFVAAPKLDRDALVDIGQVYVYPLTGSNQPVQTLAAPQSYPKAAFGTALAQSDNWLAIGAPGVIKDDGRVYLYAFEQGQWVYRKVLMPIGKGSRFGASVAMSGDWLMVGAPKAQSNPDPKVKLRNGAVYAYRLHGDDWQAAPAGTLPLPDPDLFRTGELGTELSLAGDIFAVSAPFASVTTATGLNRAESGRVFMYSYDAGSQTWLRGSYLQLNPEHLIRSGAGFGSTLHLSAEGHSLLVGAPLADQSPDIEGDNQLDVGRVYLYQLRNSGWAVARDRVGKSKFEQFGRTVLLGPNDIVIGNGKGTVWDYSGP
ncbi:MAG: integrin alpha, partial [Methylococcaceae bacterium]